MLSAHFSAASEEEAIRQLEASRRTDGLPIVVPTPERVERTLAFAGGLTPDSVLGDLPPANGQLTVEKAAINAVMAGCSPEIFPLVIAVCEAIVDPRFDIGPMQNTTHCIAPMIIVNGPARDLFGVSSGVGALGPGAKTNITLGRALRFILMNVGGGVPGVGDMATLGTPAKIACCLAEAEEESPWAPLHVSLGFNADDSVVTLLGTEGPHSMLFSLKDIGDHAHLFLRTLAAGFCNPCSNNIFTGIGNVAAALNPIHAQLLRKHGISREEAQRRLFEFAAISRDDLRKIAGANVESSAHKDDVMRPVPRPEDYLLFVSGQEGGAYSAYFPTWGGGKHGNIAISKKIRIDDGCEIIPSVR